jgi:hypothetical protein
VQPVICVATLDKLKLGRGIKVANISYEHLHESWSQKRCLHEGTYEKTYTRALVHNRWWNPPLGESISGWRRSLEEAAEAEEEAWKKQQKKLKKNPLQERPTRLTKPHGWWSLTLAEEFEEEALARAPHKVDKTTWLMKP